MPPSEPKLLAAMEQLAHERTTARGAVLPAIRELVTAVREILGDAGAEFLRGMPNLNVSSNPYRGFLVRTTERGSRKDGRLPKPGNGDPTDQHGWGREVLVFDDRAQLVMARCNRSGDFNYRPAVDTDLRAEDITPIMLTVDDALAGHLAAVERGTERYRQLHHLAERLRTILPEAT